MKTFKKIGFTLIPVVVLFVIIGLVPSPVTIQSKTIIEAPSNEVYTTLASFERFPEWSPFLVTDPNQKNWITGNDGELGSRFYWIGVDEEGEGFQELVIAETNVRLVMNCTISKPFESTPTFAYEIAQISTGTEVIQSFEMPSSLLEKAMLSVFGVTSEIAETNQLGMDRLKHLLES